MASLADYFRTNRYQATWHIGDRVQGQWNRIPFRGTVGNDTVVSEIQGPRVSVHIDLPIKYQDRIYTVIFVAPTDLKRFV